MCTPMTNCCWRRARSRLVPPIPGLESVKYHTFMTLKDAHELETCLTKNTRVLIVGAGLIGMKCLEGIRDRVASVTVCDLAKQVLPSILDAEAAQMVQKHCEAQDVTFLLATRRAVRAGQGHHAERQRGRI